MAKKRVTTEVIKKATENINNEKEFARELNNIFKIYQQQGTILKKINQLKNDSLQLSSTLSGKQQEILNKKINEFKIQDNIRKNLISSSNIYTGIMGSLKSIYGYLNSNDDAIKSSALNLGLSRNLSDQYRDNLIESAGYAASLGMSIGMMTKAQEAYNTQTGQSLILSRESLKSISKISQGTGLGVEGASNLVGQFKLLGLNAKNTEIFVSDTADTTSKLGLNLNTVLKDISANFDKIQSYNFLNGINGVQKMAMYASMYKISITSAFASIDKARTLEGAVEMSAKLMVMGGEFSKQNMFEIGFLARNKPEEFIKKIAEMSKSTFFFNKELGEFQSSAFDLDRLRAVSEATNIPFEELTKSARRLAEVDFAKSKMLSGLNPDDKDFLANMAEFNKTSGNFEITLGKDVLDIKSIGSQQIEALRGQEASLEQRAKDSQTFDKAFTASIEELKASLLPTINVMNDVLRWLQQFGAVGKAAIIGGMGIAVAGLVRIISIGLTRPFTLFLARLELILTKSSIGGAASGAGPVGKGGGMLGKLGGAAGGALAVGGAFLAASYGIKMIAESFKELNSEQLNAITAAIVTMGISIPVSIYAISLAATVGGKGLAIFAFAVGAVGLSVMAIGKGIEFATTGLSKMFSSLTPEIAESISKIGWGIGKMGLGLMTFGNPITILGIFAFTGFLASLSLNKNNLQNLSQLATAMANGSQGFVAFGNAIDKIGVLNNDKTMSELKELINDMNNIKISNPLTELKELLSKPIQVEFADKSVGVVVNVSNSLDGKILATNIYPHLAKLIRANSQNK